MKDPHKKRFVRYPHDRRWHRIHPQSRALATTSWCWHPDDEVMSKCGRGFTFVADDCAVMPGEEAQLRMTLPKGAKICGNCQR